MVEGSFPYEITLQKHGRSNLTFALKGKPLLLNKGTNSLNLVYLLLVSVMTLSAALHLASIVSSR